MESKIGLKEGRGIVFNILGKKGFGFIKQEDGTDIFFHSNGVRNPVFEELREGDEVEYLIATTPKGTKAIRVEVICDFVTL